MAEKIKMIEVTKDNMHESPCCGIKNTEHEGHKRKTRIVELKTFRDSQNAPTPYAVFAIIYDGQLLADHQISKSSMLN